MPKGLGAPSGCTMRYIHGYVFVIVIMCCSENANEPDVRICLDGILPPCNVISIGIAHNFPFDDHVGSGLSCGRMILRCVRVNTNVMKTMSFLMLV